jgi:hypothetical protein
MEFSDDMMVMMVLIIITMVDERWYGGWQNCMTVDSQSWGFRRNAKLGEPPDAVFGSRSVWVHDHVCGGVLVARLWCLSLLRPGPLSWEKSEV